jgi:hypothetical protein
VLAKPAHRQTGFVPQQRTAIVLNVSTADLGHNPAHFQQQVLQKLTTP